MDHRALEGPTMRRERKMMMMMMIIITHSLMELSPS
jgi:hypothetical protein